MTLTTCHFELSVSDLDRARAFYVGGLGLEVLDEVPAIGLLAVRAGGVRLSMFADPDARAGTAHVVFRTDDLDETVRVLGDRGVTFAGDIQLAPGFCRFVAAADPDGNLVEFAQYLRDPLRPNPA